MKINDEGLSIIKAFEGISPVPYLDLAGVPTIGYGSTWKLNGERVTMKHREINEKYATVMLLHHIERTEYQVDRLVKVDLTENEFSALVSFVYNVGSGNFQSSTMRQKLNRGNYSGAAGEFWKWRRAGGLIVSGLVRVTIDGKTLDMDTAKDKRFVKREDCVTELLRTIELRLTVNEFEHKKLEAALEQYKLESKQTDSE